ncbi:MAG: hypothetical protein ACM3ML_06250, partial [Micromonosporaceae bacterium]
MPGYDYTDLSEAATIAKKVVNANPQHLKSGSGHAVQHDGKTIAIILLVQVKPQYANDPQVRQNIMLGMIKGEAGAGAMVTEETIHTEKVVIARKGSAVAYNWYHAGVITEVDRVNGSSDVRDFVEAYLKAAHATGALGPPAATAPAATAPAATTPAPTISGPMTGQELLWLQAVEQLLPKMNKVFSNAPTKMTGSALASLAHQVRGCSRELARIGSPPSARLQPVYELVQQACGEYDKGAKCFANAARMGIPSSPAAVREFA